MTKPQHAAQTTANDDWPEIVIKVECEHSENGQGEKSIGIRKIFKREDHAS